MDLTFKPNYTHLSTQLWPWIGIELAAALPFSIFFLPLLLQTIVPQIGNKLEWVEWLSSNLKVAGSIHSHQFPH